MFSIARILAKSTLAAVVCGLVGIGLVGLTQGVPMAFQEFLPGDNLDRLRELPTGMLGAGIGGVAIGLLAGIASQLTSDRVNLVWSIILVTASAWVAVVFTHPHWNVGLESSFAEYFESYRLTILATLGGAVGVVALGQFLRPFQERKRAN